MNSCKSIAISLDRHIEKRAFSFGAAQNVARVATKSTPAFKGFASKRKAASDIGKSFSLKRVGMGVAIGSVPVIGGGAMLAGA